MPRLRQMAGFTLIEILVVLVVVGVLLAVAVPAFLGQTHKAHDSEAKQYLTVAYKDAAAIATDHGGNFTDLTSDPPFTAADLAAKIQESEPGLTVVAGQCPANATTDPKYVVVDVDFVNSAPDANANPGDDLMLCNDPAGEGQHTVWTLRVTDHKLLPFDSTVVSGSGTPLVDPPTNSSAPVVSGTAQVGQTLSSSTGSWAGGTRTPTSYDYQWQYSANGSSWFAEPSGGAASSYAVQAADLNRYLRVTVAAANTAGSAVASSVATAQVLPDVPAGQTPPEISGTAKVGNTLTTSTGTWTNDPTSFTYQWQSSTDGSSWDNASGAGATTSSYAVPSADLNDYLRVVVAAANSGGAAAQSSAATSAVLPASPVNTSQPTVSGTPQVGNTLTASTGSWSNSPTSYAYQWQHSTDGSTWTNASGAGATTSSYTVDTTDLNDYLRVVVTASNSGGSGSASSNATSAVLPANPLNQTQPQISGTAKVGQTLTTSDGTWSNSPTSYTYQWQSSSDGSAWSNATGTGATSSSYTVDSTDLNDYLRVVVTAANAGGSGSSSSAATSAVLPANPANTAQPTVSGTPQVGQTLTTSNGTWSNSPTSFTYQWQHSLDGSTWSNASGAGATTSSYTVASSDLNNFLRVVVTASNAGGSGSASSAATSAVLPANPVNTSQPTISGTVQVGQTLTTSNGTWTNSPTSFTYQWQQSTDGSSWTNASGSGATTNSYTVDPTDLNDYLRVVVTASNAGGSGSASSAATAAVLPANPVNTAQPTISGTVQVGQTLTTTNGTWSNSPTSFTYQWQNSSNGSTWTNASGSGATTNSYTVDPTDLNNFLRVVVTASNAGGSGSASSSATSAVLPANPVNTSAPVVSNSNTSNGLTHIQVGDVLTTTNGTWTNSPTSYSYQWQHSTDGSIWSNVASGGTSASYTAASSDYGDYIHVVVTAANAGGSAAQASATPANAASSATPASSTPPLISNSNSGNGTTHVQAADVLTTSTGSWTNCTSCTYSYQWQRSTNNASWVNVPSGGTSSSYTVQAADVGYYLIVSVTASNDGGLAAAYSASTNAVLSTTPSNTTQPLISDASNLMTHVQVGDSLSTTTGAWSDCSSCTYSYTWQRADNSGFTTNLTPVGTNASAYTVASGDLSKYLRVSVQATNDGGAASVFSSNATNAVLPATPTNTGGANLPAISGTVRITQTLTTTTGTWSGTPTSYAYQWQNSSDGTTGWTNVASGGTASTYVIQTTDSLKYLRANVTATNTGGPSAPASSNVTIVVPQTYLAAVTASSPAGYWRLGEATPGTGTAVDSSGNGRNGTYVASPLSAAGAISYDSNTAVAFNGSSQYVDIATNPALKPTVAASYEAWIKTNSPLDAKIVSAANGGSTSAFALRTRANGKAFVTVFTSTALSTPDGLTTVTDNQWHYLVGTYDGANLRLYVDGKLDASVAKTGTIAYDSSNPLIGSFLGTNLFAGTIDEVAIYSAALTCGTVTVGQLCTAGSQIYAHRTAGT